MGTRVLVCPGVPIQGPKGCGQRGGCGWGLGTRMDGASLEEAQSRVRGASQAAPRHILEGVDGQPTAGMGWGRQSAQVGNR